MMRLIFKAAAAASAIFFIGAGAQAATLSLSGGTAKAWGSGNYDSVCEGGNTTCYNPSGAVASSLTEDLSTFTSTMLPPGLELVGGPGTIRVTFLGKEAGATNRAFEMGGNSLSTLSSAIGDSYTFTQGSGDLIFSFWTSFGGGAGKTASNTGSPFDVGLSMGFSQVSSRLVYGFFDDSGGVMDADFDDMVVKIEVIPVPAAAIPLLTGMGVLGFMARRRRKAKS